MAEPTKRDLMNEIEELNATVYNLRKYMAAAFKLIPHLKKTLNERFDGMPGFTDPGK